MIKRYQIVAEHKYSKEVTKMTTSMILSFIKKIFDWNSTFGFSSRFMNTMVVSLVTLYYVFVQLAYAVFYLLALFNKFVPSKLIFSEN